MAKPPFNTLNLAPASVDVETLAGGGCVLRSPLPLGNHHRCVGEMLEHWAWRAPDRVWMSERQADGSRRQVTYAQALQMVRAIGQALLDRGLGPDRPVALLSDNGIDHALLQMGGMHVGVPVSPISPAYSLMSQDFGKLKYILGALTPGLIYAVDGAKFERALTTVDLGGAEVVVSANPLDKPKTTLFTALTQTAAGEAVDRAFEAVGPDDCAKILFTSGSTGLPKGVINTQRMMCSNQKAIAQLWPYLEEKPPEIVDWLPWSHTFGGNHNFNMMLRNGGTLHIDGGKPVPGLVEVTVQNLREISPTIYFNVPRGFDALIPYLEDDDNLRSRFFERLDMIFYAGAALPQNLWEKLEDLSIQTRGERVRMVSAWGSTETAPMATSVHFDIDRAGVIGLPAPGTAIKLVPNGAKLELRVKGPNITPGYWRADAVTRDAFDEDGYYKIGDAGRLADDNNPAAGIVFDGRVAEDFKLTSGTWVHVGQLRLQAIASAAPVIQDAVVTGHDLDVAGLLAFASPAGCKALCPDLPADTPLKDLVRQPAVRERLIAGLSRHNDEFPANSTRIARVLLMAEPPNIDKGEITDKGYINQRAVLDNRYPLVERLYAAGSGDADVIILD